MATIASLIVKINGDMSDLAKALASAETALGRTGKKMESIGKAASIALTLPIAGAGAAIIKTGMEFEAAMSGVTSLMSPAEKQAEKTSNAMHDLALKMGAETTFGATDAAKAIEELIKAGVSTEAIMSGGLKSALDLAVAGNLELADAAEIASTALNSFKKDGLSVEKAANFLAGAANASATSVGELKFGLSAVASVAAGVGQTFEGTTAALAVLAQNGLKGSDAGTSLKTMLMNLQPTTKAATAAMSELGLITKDGTNAFVNADGTFKSMAQISGILQNSMKGLTDAQRMQALETIFGSDAIRAANIMFAEGEQGLLKMQAAMSNVTAAEVAKEKMNNLKGSIEQLKGGLETMAVKMYEANDGAIKSLVDGLGGLVDKFSALSPSTQQTIIIIGLVVAAIPPLLMLIGSLITSITTLVGVVTLVTAPIWIWIAAIAAVVAAIAILYAKNEAFRNFINVTWKAIKDVIVLAVQAIVAFITPAIRAVVEFMTAQFKDFAEFWHEVWPNLKEAFMNIWNGIKMFIEPLLTAIVAYFKFSFNLIVDVVKIAWELIKGLISAGLKVIEGVIQTFAGLFTGNWEMMWNGIAKVFEGIWDGIKATLKGAINFMGAIINRFIDGFNSIKITIPAVTIPMVGTVGGFSIGMPQIPKIPMLDVGTNYVQKSGLAMIHEGEAVVPKKYNPANGGNGGNAPIINNIYLDGKLIQSVVDNRMGGRMNALGAV